MKIASAEGIVGRYEKAIKNVVAHTRYKLTNDASGAIDERLDGIVPSRKKKDGFGLAQAKGVINDLKLGDAKSGIISGESTNYCLILPL